MKARKLTAIFSNFLSERNRRIIRLRKKGIPLKRIANKFKLSERQISRITKNVLKCPKMSVDI